jgi:cobalt-zinc-cadmium efflux system protein
MEILAALANGVTLVLVALYIFREAWVRFRDPPQVVGPLMLGVAVGGLLVNLAGLYWLHGGRDQSLNIQGAWLHVLADAAGSVGAILAAGVVWSTGWNMADPLASVLIGVLVLVSSWQILRKSVSVLLEASPAHIDVEEVRGAMLGVKGVESVHDLHIWTITSGMVSLSAHVERSEARRDRDVLQELRDLLRSRFGINHSTIQLEPAGFPETDAGW